MKELLLQYNPWWEEDFKLNGIKERRTYLAKIRTYMQSKSIVFLTGIRRVGKTTIMKILIQELINSGVSPRNILYVSLDDYFLNDKTIFDVLHEYRGLHKIKLDEKIYLFLDEITYQDRYNQQLKNIYDLQNVKIIATSSSSSLLKDNKAFLTGRSVLIEVNPLDFDEYLFFKDITIKQRDSQLLDGYFRDYIKVGGMPENVLNPHREYLMNLVDDIIQKDITLFYGLKDHRLLKNYFILLMERSGKQVSINKIANILNISPDTSRRYLYYFESTYLIHLLSRFGKPNAKILSAKKVYATDLGIKHLFVGERDFGSYFENYVYLRLKEKGDLYYLYEDAIEIDFYTESEQMIEVKYNASLNEKQQALFDRYPAKEKIIIDSVNKLELLK